MDVLSTPYGPTRGQEIVTAEATNITVKILSSVPLNGNVTANIY